MGTVKKYKPRIKNERKIALYLKKLENGNKENK